jgi:hypothetical protein
MTRQTVRRNVVLKAVKAVALARVARAADPYSIEAFARLRVAQSVLRMAWMDDRNA